KEKNAVRKEKRKVAIPIPSSEGQNILSCLPKSIPVIDVAIPIPSSEGQNLKASIGKPSKAAVCVAIPIPSSEGQNSTYYALKPGCLRRNTYTF
ncbi:hypothetical protein, partial [Cylindrospermopsis raciborskii]|uniref:hypothetical protein n=1 Tax=Cylindrospermopsis raciborskii TaxID=77022 RepID=UPI001B3B10D4